MVTLPKKSLERHLLASGHGSIIAVDEVGMGCLAGPVVVCAISLPAAFFRRRWPALERLRDSKLLAAHQRERYAAQLAGHPLVRHVFAVVHPKEIDRLNVYQASRVGMLRAVRKIANECPTPHLLVDGPRTVAGIALPQTAVVKGDRRVFAIAAASVLAKVHRDALMVRMSARYPGYGLERHKGYATKAHYGALRMLGPSPLHRRSFRL